MSKSQSFYRGPFARRGSYKKGFNLIEVLLAISLIVLGVLAIMDVMSSGIASDNSVEGQSVALRLAEEKMEDIKNTAYASIAASSRAALASPFSNYEREVVLDHNDSPQTATKLQVTVSVYWTMGRLQNSVTLTTLIAKPS